MSIYSLTSHDSERLLSLNQLPSFESQTGRLIEYAHQQLCSDDQMISLFSGAKLLVFGAAFSAEKLFSVLMALGFEKGKRLAVCHYQPCPSLSPAAVISGVGEVDRSLLQDLSVSLNIELVLIDQAPMINKPGLLVMDMDSTAIKIECIDQIAALAGVGDKVALVTKRAMQGELDFAMSLHQRVAALADCDEQVLAQVLANLPLMEGLENLVTQLQKFGWQVAIASGGFTYFTEHLKARLNLCATFANVLEIQSGKLTGKVLGDVVDANVKAQCVQDLAAQYGIAPTQTVAIGDGANDLAMLAKAQLGVAFHAKPVVREQAKAAINVGPLDQLLYLLLPSLGDMA